MNSLPIVLREMRVTARKRWIYRARVSMALVGIVTWLFVFLAGPARSSERGILLLIFLSAIAQFVALLSGVFLTADCLSEEKREGTLGLLFLTPLQGYDVVFGKLAANAAVAFFGLLAILPILCLPLLTGGVTWMETLRVMLVLILSLAFSLSVGIFVSSRSVDSRKAFVGTLLGVVLMAAVPIVAVAVREMFVRRVVPDSLFFQFSPVYTLIFAFELNYNRFTNGFYWRSVSLLILMTLVLLIAACRIIRTSWQVREPSLSAKGKLAADNRRRRPARARLALPKEVSRGSDLYAWLSFRGLALGAGAPWFFTVLTVFWFIMLVSSGIGRRSGGQQAFMIAMLTAFGLHALMKAILALEATRQIHQDVRSGNMQLLLATPLREWEIVRGQVEACRRGFRGPLFLLSCVNVLMELSIFVFYDRLQMRSVSAPFSVFFMGGMLALHLDSRAIQWVGIWKSLQAQTHLRATLATLTSVLGIPWILFPMLFAFAVNQRGGRTEEAMTGWMMCWFVIGLWLDLMLIRKAKRQLRTRFRESAAQTGT